MLNVRVRVRMQICKLLAFQLLATHARKKLFSVTVSAAEIEMSVLNQSGEEQVECPLCMEPLEVDDLNFFPCTCGYQICRFCWHRIRTDENGLCPACRKAYSENPADFIPLSQEQVAKLKAEKRQRDQQRKAKLAGAESTWRR
ncbi:hypothetical protein NQ318_005693 [Aromia moschata]|uniref:RING-type domain-containing protein n=1 Tax=Aromia moschata TaxID=1265417 RepID=A0AAV8XK40_9CUCU|nr:hypothetical protein NQ318_005693 [Aromia moschata]